MPATTGKQTLLQAKTERLTANGDISAHGSVLIVVNRSYNDSIDILWSIRQ